MFGEFNHYYEILLPTVRNFPTNGVIWEVDVPDGEKEKLIEEKS